MSVIVESTFAVTGVGTGKPDYQSEIARGNLKQGVVNLLATEKIKIFMIAMSDAPSFFPWVIPPLAPGASVHMMDVETGSFMPYTVPAGYNFIALSVLHNYSELIRGRVYIELPPLPLLATMATEMWPDTLGIHYQQEVTAGELISLDPTLSNPHRYDVIGTNMGLANCYGSGHLTFIQRQGGTPPWSTTKNVRCRLCGVLKEVPVEATVVKCDACGATTVVQYLPPGGAYKLPSRL